MSARVSVAMGWVLVILGCSAPYEAASGTLVLETDDGEPGQGIALLRVRTGDVERVELLTDPLLDRRGVASLRFPLELTPDDWRALVEEGGTLTPEQTAQYRLERPDGAIVRRAITSMSARWVAPGELVFEGELGPAAPRPEDDPPPDLADVASTVAFDTRWRAVVHCQIVEGEVVRDDTQLESEGCRELVTRAGFAQCLEPGVCD